MRLKNYLLGLSHGLALLKRIAFQVDAAILVSHELVPLIEAVAGRRPPIETRWQSLTAVFTVSDIGSYQHAAGLREDFDHRTRSGL